MLALAPTVPVFVARTARSAEPGKDQRVLVVVQLDGGNDALNTVVPHADPEYAKLRPTLKIAAKDLVKVNDSVGLHPSLKPLAGLLEKGRLAVVPGVSYPNPNRSHFRRKQLRSFLLLQLQLRRRRRLRSQLSNPRRSASPLHIRTRLSRLRSAEPSRAKPRETCPSSELPDDASPAPPAT